MCHLWRYILMIFLSTMWQNMDLFFSTYTWRFLQETPTCIECNLTGTTSLQQMLVVFPLQTKFSLSLYGFYMYTFTNSEYKLMLRCLRKHQRHVIVEIIFVSQLWLVISSLQSYNVLWNIFNLLNKFSCKLSIETFNSNE